MATNRQTRSSSASPRRTSVPPPARNSGRQRCIRTPIDSEEEYAPLVPQITVYSDPLYLPTEDTNVTTLVSFKLTGLENFTVWSLTMTNSLLIKNKLVFVDGRYPAPSPTSEYYVLWERCNAACLAWIKNSLSEQLQVGFIYATNAAELWLELHTLFNQEGPSRMYDLFSELSLTRQGGEEVSIYFCRLKRLWDEQAFLIALESPELVENATWKAHQGEMNLFQFLRGLDDSYGALRDQMLMMEPLPTIHRAFSIINNAEYRRKRAGKTMDAN